MVVQGNLDYEGARKSSKEIIGFVLRQCYQSDLDEGDFWKVVDWLRAPKRGAPAIMRPDNFEPSDEYVKHYAEDILRFKEKLQEPLEITSEMRDLIESLEGELVGLEI